MRKWLENNSALIIRAAFLIPIVIVAIVSISHVTQWYQISNPPMWATYLSIGIEVAALSALAALSAKMGNNVYFPFIIVTLIQFIGNIYFSYYYINTDSKEFTMWVELTSPLVDLLGFENVVLTHKRVLSVVAGGLLPLISLSFLHMLVKYNKEKKETLVIPNTDDVVSVQTMDGADIEEIVSDPVSKEEGIKDEAYIEEDIPDFSESDVRSNKEKKQTRYSKYTYGGRK